MRSILCVRWILRLLDAVGACVPVCVQRAGKSQHSRHARCMMCRRWRACNAALVIPATRKAIMSIHSTTNDRRETMHQMYQIHISRCNNAAMRAYLSDYAQTHTHAFVNQTRRVCLSPAVGDHVDVWWSGENTAGCFHSWLQRSVLYKPSLNVREDHCKCDTDREDHH